MVWNACAQSVLGHRRVAGQGGGGPWYDTDYQRRVSITFLSSQITSTMTNMTAAVGLEDLPPTFHTNVQSDADDVRASKDDHTTGLDIDLDHYDSTNDDGIVWVSVGSMSNSVDTVVYLYYDYASATAYPNPQDCWDATGSNYMVVYHMGGTATSAQPSATGDANHDAASYNLESGDLIDGKVGQCIDFDGSNEYYAVAVGTPGAYDLRPDTTFTAMMWFQADDFTDGVIMQNSGSSTSQGYGAWIWSSQLRPSLGNGGNVWTNLTEATSGLSTGTWYHYAFTWDGSSARAYLDGSAISNSPETEGGAWSWANQPFYIARRESAGYYHGKIDEIRVHDNTFAATTIAWVHQNQDDPSTTYTVGTEETQ